MSADPLRHRSPDRARMGRSGDRATGDPRPGDRDDHVVRRQPLADAHRRHRPRRRLPAGVCNIGPEEIRRRRRSGHIGAIGAVGLFAVLVAVGAPPIGAVVGSPAVIAASGYLQAHLRFCAGFGQVGVFNFGTLGETEHVVDDEARAMDKAKARQIGLMSFAVGIAVAIVAVVVPL